MATEHNGDDICQELCGVDEQVEWPWVKRSTVRTCWVIQDWMERRGSFTYVPFPFLYLFASCNVLLCSVSFRMHPCSVRCTSARVRLSTEFSDCVDFWGRCVEEVWKWHCIKPSLQCLPGPAKTICILVSRADLTWYWRFQPPLFFSTRQTNSATPNPDLSPPMARRFWVEIPWIIIYVYSSMLTYGLKPPTRSIYL